MGKLTKAQREQMKPFVDHVLAMVIAINQMSDAEIDALDAVAAAHEQTNCWFRAFDTARIVSDLISTERSFRRGGSPKAPDA